MSKSTRITELASIISESTAIVNDYFESRGLPAPSFDVSGPSRIAFSPQDKGISDAQMRVLEATDELHRLMQGPTNMLMEISAVDSLSLHGIYAFNMASTFPINEETTFEKISQKCGLNVIDTRRILRHAMTNHIFREPRPGVVAHTAASRLLAENSLIRDFVGMGSEETFQSAAYAIEALQKYGYPKEPNQSGFSLGHKTSKGLYEELRDHPSRGNRFANSMSAFASRIPLDPLISKYDWNALGSATIVDVGGGYGPVSIGLAKAFPHLKFIVQDFEDVVAEGPEHVPAAISDRLSFMGCDMMRPQVVEGAEVYFFRAIFHNWTDHYCVKILRNHIPALKSGTRLLIVDSCLHEPGSVPWYEEKRKRTMDLHMLSFFGSRERTVSDWEEIFKEADERFDFNRNVIELNGTGYLLEVWWRG